MRGRPAVYATFSSYDEVAHHSGLERADTLEALRKLDQQFGRIDRARRYAPRPYELVVLSDHGQTQGATFKQRNGYGLDELVERSLARGSVTGVSGGDEQHSMVAHAVGEATGRPDKTKRPKKDVSDRFVVVLGSGNLGLISLLEEPRRLTLEEIDERHPELLPALRAHPHVGWLLVRSSKRGPVALGRERRQLPRRGQDRRRGPARTVLAHGRTAPPPHGRLPARGRHHGRQLLRPPSGGGLRFRGADLLPRRARRPPDASRSSSTPSSWPCPSSRSSARSRFTACSPAGGGRSRATARRAAVNIVWAALIIAAGDGCRRRRHAARAARRPGGQSLPRRRPRVRSVRRARDRLLGAARLHRLSRVRELRRVARRRRGGGARARAAGPDGRTPRPARSRSPDGPADLLRPLGRAHRVAAGHRWNTR